MCYTSTISLISAVIEFSIVIYLVKIIKDKKLRTLPFFVLFLGFYQLTEFLLCSTNNLFWARLGFLAYIFLPIILIQLFYDFYHKNLNKLFYIIPIFYAIIALFYPYFITEANCQNFFVSTTNSFMLEHRFMLWIYLGYYALIPFGLAVTIFNQNIHKVNLRIKDIRMKIVIFSVPLSVIISELYLMYSLYNNIGPKVSWIVTSLLIILTSILITILCFFKIQKNWLYKSFFILMSSSIITTFILYGLFPGFGYSFSSIYCHFALLYSLTSILFVSVVQEKKYSKVKKK